jgi:DNA primase
MLYTKESLELLKQRIDLVEVLSPFVEFSRSGSLFKAKCPFHDERTPSFIIQRSDSHYHCYGCSAHGDAIEFLMTHQRMSFVESVEYLANRFNVTLEKENDGNYSKTPRVNKNILKDILFKANSFFHFYLLHTKEGQFALQYLYSRGYDLNFIKTFLIGFAPKDGNIFLNAMKEQKITLDQLEDVGLIKKNSYNKTFSFFSDRITIPILDNMSSVIGFSARKIKQDTYGPKYLNTPETILFKKKKILFGLSFSKKQITKSRKAIIVEGQFDALKLITSGFSMTVASQGTAFGQEQAQELVHLGVNRVYLVFDSDTAGIAAAIKTGNIFQNMAVDVFVVSLPEGLDPDTILKEKGPKVFQTILKNANDYLTFLVKTYSSSLDVTTPSGKNELISKIAKQIKSWNQPVMVYESLKKLAKLTNISEELLDIENLESSKFIIKKQESLKNSTIDSDLLLEKTFLRWLFLMGDSKIIFAKIAKENLEVNNFKNPLAQKLYSTYLSVYEKSLPRDLLSLAIVFEDQESKEFLAKLIETKVKKEKALFSFVSIIEKMLARSWFEKREEMARKIKLAKTDVDQIKYAKEFNELLKKKPSVKLPDGISLQ